MKLKERFAKARLKREEQRRETKAFKKIVEKRELQARRQSYEAEAIVQARLKGKRLAEEKANKPSWGQRIGQAASGTVGFVDRATGVTKKRKVVVRRAPVKKRRKYVRTTRRIPLRRRAPARKIVYVTRPLAKRRKRKVVKKATSQPKQDNLYSDILGF